MDIQDVSNFSFNSRVNIAFLLIILRHIPLWQYWGSV